MKHSIYILIAFATILFYSCQKDDPIVTAISLDKSEIEIYVGETYQFEVSHISSDAPTPKYKWEVADYIDYRPAGVAKVTDSGLLTALKEGETEVKVSTTEVGDANGQPFVATCRVKVKPVAAAGIKLNKNTLTLKSGETEQLSYTISPENTTYKDVEWKSSDEKVATVSPLGVVKATGIGEAVITVNAKKDQAVKAVCNVKVKPTQLEKIELNQYELIGDPGTNKQLTVIFYPENATNKNLIWKSSNEKVAVVNEYGLVTLKSTGSCEISATSEEGGFTAICLVTVNKVEVSTIMFLDGLTEISTGESKKLRYSVLPSGAVEEGLIWTSSDESIATVENGVVTGHAPGSVTIRVRNEKGSFSETTRVHIISSIQKNIEVSIELKPKPGYGPYAATDFICWVNNKNSEEVYLDHVDFYTTTGGRLAQFWWNFPIPGGTEKGVQETLPYVPSWTNADIHISYNGESYVFTVDVVFPEN
ncbi:Ig-like domain-containing protein [Parabacteroides timonensis]|uniref:Ig-like domain-containing protein n=1 Tax=Parabacteroides timonensis TaxID=1871013 RepID=UPI00094EC7DF|nr:Ig-like domain-containing protein [Parabacteroides timonensis]